MLMEIRGDVVLTEKETVILTLFRCLERSASRSKLQEIATFQPHVKSVWLVMELEENRKFLIYAMTIFCVVQVFMQNNWDGSKS